MKTMGCAAGIFRVTVQVGTESRGVRVDNGTVHGLENWNRWDGVMEPKTSIMLGGMINYSPEYLARVLSRAPMSQFADDLIPVIYGGVFEQRCTSLEAAVGAALYDMLQTHEVGDDEGYLIDGDLFVLEPPVGQELVKRPCYYIVADKIHVADTRDVKPEYLRELLGERHLPEWAMGTRWTDRRANSST